MLTRIHRSMREKDEGFTLIELLVVMIIIGILAAIAIPVFLSQRAKARDTATKSDVSIVGREIASYYVDGAGPLTATAGGTTSQPTLTLANTTDGYSNTIKLSANTALQTGNSGADGFTSANTSTAWCIGLTNASGSQKTYKFNTSGLATGACP